MNDFPKPPAASPAPPVAHIDALPLGARLNEFEILSLLGVGGFGMVYRAYDHSLHRTVAIKEYMPSALAGRPEGLTVSIRSSGDQETYLSGLRSFVAEARLLAQFDHASLVKVYRFWEANNTAYMVMPLYSGMTLRQARSQMQNPPPEAWLRQVLWSILEALQYLHENNTVHRDVSPDNIFLQDVGPPVLLDLGAARRAINDRSQKHTAILKVNYAPIEQYAEATDMPQGPWTDLYSLAAVVHGCLCNTPPLPATFRVLRDRLPSFASVAQTVQTHFGQSYSSEFVQAIAHALEIQPQDRPQSVPAFSDEMVLSPPDDILRFSWREGFTDLHPPSDVVAADDITQSNVSRSGSSGAALKQSVAQKAERQSGAGPVDHDGTSLTSDSLFPDTAIQSFAADPPTGENSGLPPPSKYRKAGVIAAVSLVLLAGLGFWGLRSPSRENAPPSVSAVPGLSESSGDPLLQAQSQEAPSAVNVTGAGDRSKKPDKPETQSVFGVVPPPQVAVIPTTARKPGPASAASPGSATDPLKKAQAQELGAPRSATPASRNSPVEICAKSNFLTRPMCIHLECKKPEYAHLAVCVEDRKRYPDN